MGRLAGSLLGAVSTGLRQNVSATPLVVPPFPLEHLEHRDVFFVERIALDYLQMHRLKPPLAGDGNLFGREPIFDLGHAADISDSARKVTDTPRPKGIALRFTS